MDMIRGDGEAESHDLLGAGDSFDLLDQEWREERPQDLPIELRPPHEMVIELIMRVAAPAISQDILGILGDRRSLIRGTHRGGLREESVDGDPIAGMIQA